MNYFLYITMPTMRLVHATRSIFDFGIWGLEFFGIGIVGPHFLGLGFIYFFLGLGFWPLSFPGLGILSQSFLGWWDETPHTPLYLCVARD